MTHFDLIGLDTPKARVRNPSGAPCSEEWEDYRLSTPTWRRRVRHTRRRLNGEARAWGL